VAKSGMGRLIFSINVTLDGCCDHTQGIADDDLHRYWMDLLNDSDGALWGRVTYQLMESDMPSIARNGTGPKSMVDFARMLDNKPKYVVSSTLDKVQWNNSFLIKGPLADEVSKLKLEGKNLVLSASRTLASELARLGLIDEYRLLVHPIVAGRGPRLFEGITDRLDLKLADSRRFSSGVVMLRYTRSQGD
jgi:dihydrofolate reductase